MILPVSTLFNAWFLAVLWVLGLPLFAVAHQHVLSRGAADTPAVALTFDDGPNPDATPQILTILEQAHVQATFFVVGRCAQAYPDLIARMVRDGDAVENHSWGHEKTVLELPRAFRRSLQRTARAIEAAGAPPPRYFRPPYGAYATWTVKQAQSLGERVVRWSVPLSGDWRQPGTDIIVQRSLAGVKSGGIVVLHDGDEGKLCAGTPACDRRQDIVATARLIGELQARHFRLVTIPTLFEEHPVSRNVARDPVPNHLRVDRSGHDGSSA